MVLYTCPRCHYETDYKNNMRTHYKRKKACKSLFSRVSLNELLEGLERKGETVKISKDEHERRNNAIQEIEEIKNNYESRISEYESRIDEYESKMEQPEYLYLIHVREFRRLGESIYKIGRTSCPERRISDYPKGSVLVTLICCMDSKKAESQLLDIFTDKFERRLDYGREYFEGDPQHMVQEMTNFCRV